MLCIPSSIFFSYIDIYIVCRSLQICGLCSTPKAFIRERSLSCHVWTLFFEVSFTFSRLLWQAGVAGGSWGYIFEWNCENNPCVIRKLMIGSLIECRYDFSDLKLTRVLHLFLLFFHSVARVFAALSSLLFMLMLLLMADGYTIIKGRMKSRTTIIFSVFFTLYVISYATLFIVEANVRL